MPAELSTTEGIRWVAARQDRALRNALIALAQSPWSADTEDMRRRLHDGCVGRARRPLRRLIRAAIRLRNRRALALTTEYAQFESVVEELEDAFPRDDDLRYESRELFEWLVNTESADLKLYITLAAARKGCVAFVSGAPAGAWRRNVLLAAALRGQRAVIEFMRPDSDELRLVVEGAARGGHVELLEWVRGMPRGSEAFADDCPCHFAAFRGQTRVLRWLHRHVHGGARCGDSFVVLSATASLDPETLWVALETANLADRHGCIGGNVDRPLLHALLGGAQGDIGYLPLVDCVRQGRADVVAELLTTYGDCFLGVFGGARSAAARVLGEATNRATLRALWANSEYARGRPIGGDALVELAKRIAYHARSGRAAMVRQIARLLTIEERAAVRAELRRKQHPLLPDAPAVRRLLDASFCLERAIACCPPTAPRLNPVGYCYTRVHIVSICRAI